MLAGCFPSTLQVPDIECLIGHPTFRMFEERMRRGFAVGLDQDMSLWDNVDSFHRLFERYEPGMVHACRLMSALNWKLEFGKGLHDYSPISSFSDSELERNFRQIT